MPTPPALINAQNPISYGADETGANDSTSAFQSALDAGDLDVPAGTFTILGTVYPPSSRHIQCEPGSYLQTANSQTSNLSMFNMDGTIGNSIFYCQFRGPNADLFEKPPFSSVFQSFIQIRSVGGVSAENTIANNDFNGIGGFIGAIMIYGNDSNQPGPQNNLITYNTFEHCGYYALQLTSGMNNTVSYNTLNDCSGFVEADDNGQVNTGNIVDSNHLTFTYGIGLTSPDCISGCGFNGLTGGANARGAAYDYSGNSVTNNIVDGAYPSTIYEAAAPGGQPASYSGNTCIEGCQLNVYR
jgi:hypothetical protein